MPTTTIEAVYEQGSLRLSRPIDLAEGTRVDVIVIPRAAASELQYPPQVEPTESETRKRTPAEIMAAIAAMALQSGHPTQDARDHDRILYGETSSQ